MTIAELGLKVDSSSVVQATPALEKMAVAAGQAETAALRMAGAVDTSAVAQTRNAVAAKVETASLDAEAAAARLAASAHSSHGSAVGGSAAQMMALTHVARSMTEQLAMGVPITQALTGQFSHLSFIMSGPGGLTGALGGVAEALAPALPIILAVGAAVGAVAAIFGGLTTKINETAKTQVNFGDVFMATVQLAAESIGHFFKPAIDQLSTWWRQFVDWIAPIFKSIGNGLVGSFVGAFNAVKDTWSLLPAALGDLVIQAVNGVIGAVEGMINNVSHSINSFIEQINKAIQAIPEQFRGGFQGIGTIGDVGFGRVANPNAGAAGKVANVAGSDFASALGTDFMGQAFDAISKRAQQLELASKSADKLSHSLKAANDNAKLLAGGLKDVGGVTDLVAKSQQAMTDAALGAFGQLTGGLSQLFKDNKAFAVANAVVNTAEGITKALAQGGIFGAVAAAGVAAAGAAQIASILAAQPGSATAPSAGSASASTQTAAGAQPSTSINLTIKGSGLINVDDFANQLAKSIADGGNQSLVKVIRAA